MRTPRRYKSIVLALYVNAAVVVLLALVLLGRGAGAPDFASAAFAQPQPQIGGGAGVFIVPAQFSDTSYGCYIMDVDAQTVCAYQYFGKQLKLVAARNFRWDRRLNRFNTEGPNPDEVRQMVEQEQQDARVRERNERNPDPEPQQKQ